MKINVREFLKESGINEPFYPGKRLIHQCRQTGEFKSHSLVLDWRHPGKIRLEIKAGLSGRDLKPKKLKHYPVCFQTPSYIEIEMVNDNEEDKEGEGDKESASGKGGGGKAPARKNLDDLKLIIPHQASGAGMELVRRKLNIDKSKYMDILAKHGNMIAASIQLALHYAIEEGRINSGDKVRLRGTSAGMGIGVVAD